VVEETTQYRIAMISDGFPHYVHLLTEKLLWEIFTDLETIRETKPKHYTSAVTAAVIDIEPYLKTMYEKASLKYKADYENVLWAVADDHELQRRSKDIFDSYVRIIRSINEKPLSRETFNHRMNALKKPAHASILKANRQGWYRFSEAVVRGYVRLRAEHHGVQLGRDHPLDGKSLQSLGNAPAPGIFRSRE
jgi:hypothetical protein